MSLSEKLREAKTLAVEHNTRDAAARDKNGKPVAALSPAACSWCALGACTKVAHTSTSGPFATWLYGTLTHTLGEAITALNLPQKGYSTVAMVNDRLGIQAVAEMFDKAIEIAEEKERLAA